MREGRPSFTAAAVAAARGLASIDPLAADLLPRPFGPALHAIEAAARRAPWLAAACNAATLGLVDHIELRTAAIDEALRDALESGAEQLVILGAGLDARAWRVPGLERAVVFEIDHPSTQAYKRARFETRASMAAEVRFVAVDFERESLADALANAGHHESARTFWIWEGVTPYLVAEATRATLAVIAARSARGSRLALTYAMPEGSALGPALSRAALVVFRGLGEPIRGMWTAQQIADLLDEVGFDVVDDTAPEEWPGASSRRRILLIRERLVVAERR
jgi:methyltransferase (TIGR00027 family)